MTGNDDIYDRNDKVGKAEGQYLTGHVSNLSHWAVTHPAFTTFLMLACGVAGVMAYLRMGRAEDPTFTIKTIVVSAAWPGATAEEMQKQVADEIENKLRQTPYLDFLQTYCLPENCQIMVQLKDSVPSKKVEDVWYQVRKKLRDMELKAGSKAARGQKGAAHAYNIKSHREEERRWVEQAEGAYARFVSGWNRQGPKRARTDAANEVRR